MKAPSPMGYPIKIEQLKATFFTDKELTPEEKEVYIANKLRAYGIGNDKRSSKGANRGFDD